jgi:CheY-like chemotaxis protein/anti-sigma regulatory factor (Ser/Thr protein kinase)
VEAERALRAAQERAEAAEAKERFLANMSHELRTPLNSVIGFAGLLGVSALDEAQAGYLSRISEAGQTLLTIINDLIDLSELDGGEVALEIAPFDPARLLHDALVAIEPATSAKGLTLELFASEDLDVRLLGDARRIGAVVSQYLSNAVKYTDQGRVTVALAGGIQGEDAFAFEVSVSDTGPGVDAGMQSHLFSRFTQGDDSTRKRVGGAGVGLAICKELISLMGGEVGVESEPGRGARFWFRLALPVAPGQAGQRAGEDRPLTVLYADDHEANRVLVQRLLESQGHRCDVVNDGAEAVVAVRTGIYDLVLMDIQMPVQDGVSATIDIRAGEGPSAAVPIIALTANTLAEQKQSYAAAGLNDCIAKPVRVDELFERLAFWAAKPAAADSETGSLIAV